MKITEFDYHLPQELIAQEPLAIRDASRLLVLERKECKLTEEVFRNITRYLSAGDCIVLNNTKVVKARVFGYKSTGAKIEFLFVRKVSPDAWEVLIKPAKRLKEGSEVFFGNNEFRATILAKTPSGNWHVTLTPFFAEALMDRFGSMPTPPYIKQELRYDEQYQTVYAQHKGAIAAPTAGLHFTDTLLKELKSQGVNVVYITLHVGLGTFRQIQSDDVTDHSMEEERFEIDHEAAALINETKERGARVCAVGTTAVRALETAARKRGRSFAVESTKAYSRLFITPGYTFKIVDCLLTNFHLPRSTNYVLASTFAGLKLAKEAYRLAIENAFRFYSFGDAMLIL